MTMRARFLSILAVALLAAVLVPLGTGSVKSHAASASTIFPTIYVNYTDNCTFTIVNDAGQPITSMPPGTYEVQVNTPIMFKLLADEGIPAGSELGCGIGWVQFQLTGPDVNYYTTLTVGCDSTDTSGGMYFPPSSSFVAVDESQPSVTRTVITTTATGSPTDPNAQSSDLPSFATTSGGQKLNALGQPIKSATPTIVGTLTGTVLKSGRLALTDKGHAVATLPTGEYKVTVTDTSKKAGFVLGDQTSHKTTVVAKVGATGTHTVTVTLGAGQWFYASTASAKKTYFIVTS